MNFICFTFILFLIAIPPSRLEAADTIFYQAGCGIYDKNLIRVKDFGGSRCLFINDGSLIVSDGKGMELTRFSELGDVIWKRKLSTHHQMNLSLDQSRVLILSEEVHKNEWCQTRYDSFLILDTRTGKTLHQLRLYKIRKKYFREHSYAVLYKTRSILNLPEKTECAISHFNSIYEIPENSSADRLSAFKAGNVIVNTADSGFYILDRNLKDILWHGPRSGFGGNIHDVQVLRDGNVLVYSNDGLKGEKIQTTINLFNPVSEKIETLFPVAPLSSQHARAQGGVQITGEGLLITLNVDNDGTRLLLIDKKGRIKLDKRLPLGMSPDNIPFTAQEVKEVNLDLFLQKNHL